MRNRVLLAIGASCLTLFGCRGESSTAPHCCPALAGTWAGTNGNLTIRIVMDTATLCSHATGYCAASGTGTYNRVGGDTGTFSLSAEYRPELGQPANMNMGDFGTDATTSFLGYFESADQISGYLLDTSGAPSPLALGGAEVPMILVRQ
jgi:hypothetical protein